MIRPLAKRALFALGLLDAARSVYLATHDLLDTLKPLFFRILCLKYRVSFAGRTVGFPVYNAHTYQWFMRYRGVTHNGWHEPSITKLIEQLVDRGKIFLDVGAHLGYYAALFSSKPGNRSYAIELDPVNFKYLRKCIHSTDGVLGNVELFNIGLGSENTTVYMNSTRPSVFSSLAASQGPDAREGGSLPVEVSTLDRFVEENRIEPDIIKIDVEGYEYDVWIGGRSTFSKATAILIIEIHTPVLEARHINIDSFFEEIRAFGFSLHSFPDHRSKNPEPLQKIDAPKNLDNYDIVCIPETLGSEFLRTLEPSFDPVRSKPATVLAPQPAR